MFGVDRSQAMLELAKRNACRAGVADNTAFLEGPINAIPLPDRTADCIISNCVVNLVPDVHKPLVFREMYRLLKPGGRVAISDILAKRELPGSIRNDAALLVGCIAGANQVQEYRRWMEDAGFSEILLADTGSDLNIYNEQGSANVSGSSCCSKGTAEPDGNVAKASMESKGINLNEWVGSFRIYAIKTTS